MAVGGKGRDPFGNGVLHAVLLADGLIRLAELSAMVILPWWITSAAGSGAIAAYGATLAAATFLAAPAVSPLGDRFCKGRQIVWGLGALCLVAVAQIVLSLAGGFSLPALMALAVVQVLATSFVDPARDAVLTELVPADRLAAAIRKRKTAQAVSGILGPLLAGLALGAMGVSGGLCWVGGLLAMALFAARRIPRRANVHRDEQGFGSWWSDLRAGLAAKWLMPMERGWTAVNFVVWIFQGPAVGLLIPIKVHSLGLQGSWLGLGLGALSLGVLIGSAFGSPWLVDRFGRYRVRVGLGLVEGLAFAVVGLAASPGLLLAGLVGAGFCNASMSLVGATHRALALPQAYRVRLSAAGAMTTQLAGTLGPALVGMALAGHSVTWVYTTWGLLMATSVLGFIAVPRFREFMALDHDEAVDWYRRQYPAIFR